jgi:hypothetical protein
VRNAYEILVGNLKRRKYLENLGLGGRLILKWILRAGWKGETL